MKPQEILAQIEPLLPHVLEVRHELHRHPELSGQEHGTRGRILCEWRPSASLSAVLRAAAP